MTAARDAAESMLSEHSGVVRESVAFMVRQLIEAEVAQVVGAELGRRSEDRSTHRNATHRNGYRHRRWDTRAGTIDVAVPKLRRGSYLPSFLEPRKRHEQALVAVVQEAYVNGVSTRKVDRLVEQMGLTGLSKDQVSRMCAGLDEQVKAFRDRPLQGRYPYVWLDAKIERVRDGGAARQKALVVASGVNEHGVREVIGLDVGESETEAFWTELLHSLRARGLTGVQLVMSDAHQGLKNAIGRVLSARWQRCCVHVARDMTGHVGVAQRQLVTAAIRQIFTAEDGKAARVKLGKVVEQLEGPVPKVARLLEGAEEDLLGFYDVPSEHWAKLRSTNPLERLNREIGRRSDAVGIYPNDRALIRLAGMVLLEQNDEWLAGRREGPPPQAESAMTVTLTRTTRMTRNTSPIVA